MISVNYISISKNELEKLNHLNIHRRVISTEAELYEFNCKRQVMKHFYCFNNNKYNTITQLLQMKNKVRIKELELPNSLVKIDNVFEGCKLNKVNGTNLSLVLANRKINVRKKIDYLKKIGSVLEKMREYRNISEYKSFYINDLHEDNCLIDDNNQLHIIDMDSCKINKDDWYPSKYLCELRGSKLDKYKDYAINQDTDYYCYSVMILNYLLKYKVQDLSRDEFHQYLEYLYKIGFNYNLINTFSKLYMNCPNENPYKLLDTIDNSIYRAGYYTFKANQKHL